MDEQVVLEIEGLEAIFDQYVAVSTNRTPDVYIIVATTERELSKDDVDACWNGLDIAAESTPVFDTVMGIHLSANYPSERPVLNVGLDSLTIPVGTDNFAGFATLAAD
eukprot:Selendium_serpulae@DN5452_c0_g1_i1.p3